MNLSDPIFQNPEKARAWLEAQRWPEGPICPHCGNSTPDKITRFQSKPGPKGKSHRPGVMKCNECLEQFTVTVGTVMERSHIALHKWVLAMFLLAASKKGMSTHQIHRTLGLPYKTGWFLMHRVREAMREDSLAPFGGPGAVIEADETYFGQRETPLPRNKYLPPPTKGGKVGPGGKRAVFGLVERGGKVRTFHMQHATAREVRNIIVQNVSRESVLHTDESRLYTKLGKEFSSHETVQHSAGEYVRGQVHTNTIENVFSVFKRGMKGVYQHCGEAHLHRYLAEFDFRYNRRTALGVSDTQRAQAIARGAEGKRLMYQRTAKAANA
jgi:transposase-like protein